MYRAQVVRATVLEIVMDARVCAPQFVKVVVEVDAQVVAEILARMVA